MPDESVDGISGQPDSELPRPGSYRTVTPAVAIALVLLAAAFVLSVAFILANGGLDLPAAAPQPTASGEIASPRPTPTGTGSATPSSASTGAMTTGLAAGWDVLLPAPRQ